MPLHLYTERSPATDLPCKKGEWQSSKGHDAIRTLAKKRGYPHDLRDFQVRNVARILDGKDICLVSATSSGKSALIAIPALLCPERVTIVTESTIALQNDMVSMRTGSSSAYKHI